ncbi:MAG: hypothetical protein ACE5FL_04990 [Myxococcota bacterium]
MSPPPSGRRATPEARRSVASNAESSARARGAGAVVAVGAAYGLYWAVAHWGYFFDPNLQADDAQAVLAGLWRFGPDPAPDREALFGDFPALMPYAVTRLYLLIVPHAGVLAAAKIVQGLAFSILIVAAGILWRSAPTGGVASVSFLFFSLHSRFVISRIAGGLPRAFGFPLLALWSVGAMTGRRGVRYCAGVAAALAYPPVALLILVAELLWVVGEWRAEVRFRRRLISIVKPYASFAALCVVILLPAAIASSGEDRVVTIDEARASSAFARKGGRMKILPYADPASSFVASLVEPLRAHGTTLWGSPVDKRVYREGFVPFVLSGLLTVALCLRIVRFPRVAWTLIGAASVLYVLARAVAFHLYSPDRYYQYGVTAAGILLMTGVIGELATRVPGGHRTLAGLLVAFLVVSADGASPRRGLQVDRRDHAALWDQIGKLPTSARVASHPMDGDGIAYFGRRHDVTSYESMIPWFVESWRRQMSRSHDTLRALYATNVGSITSYMEKYGVTHFLLDRSRYREDFLERSSSFRPLSKWTLENIAADVPTQLLFHSIPDGAIVFEDGDLVLVDARRAAAEFRERARPETGEFR